MGKGLFCLHPSLLQGPGFRLVSEFACSTLIELELSFLDALLGGGSPELRLTDCQGLAKAVEYSLPQLPQLQSGPSGWGVP